MRKTIYIIAGAILVPAITLAVAYLGAISTATQRVYFILFILVWVGGALGNQILEWRIRKIELETKHPHIN